MWPMSPVCSQPSSSMVRGGGLRVVQVALHHLRAADPDLAVDADPEGVAGERVDDQHLGVRRGHADRARLEPAGGREVGHRRQLGHAVALHDLAASRPPASAASSADSGAAPEKTWSQRGEVVVVDHRVLGQRDDDRRRDEGPGDPVLLVQLEELLEVEARHRDDRGARRRPEFMSTCMP